MNQYPDCCATQQFYGVKVREYKQLSMNNQILTKNCQCSICQKQYKETNCCLPKFNDRNQGKVFLHTNDLEKFIEYSLSGCIIPIVPTNFIGISRHLSNKKKVKLSFSQLQNGATQFFSNSDYLILYYENSQKIVNRLEIRKAKHQGYKYVQVYNKSAALFSINYKKKQRNQLIKNIQFKESTKGQDRIDNVIIENLRNSIKKLTNYLGSMDIKLRNKTNKHYGQRTTLHNLKQVDDFYQKEREFHKWLIKQYGQQTLAQYLIEIHAQVIRNLTGNQIKSGSFQWIVQTEPNAFSYSKPHKFIRLVNVRDLFVEKFIGEKTFQNEFEEKVWNKIDTICHQMIKINLFDNRHKLKRQGVWKGSQSMLNNHLTKFKNDIRGIYRRQKERSLKNIQEDKHVYRTQDVQDIIKDSLVVAYLNSHSANNQGQQRKRDHKNNNSVSNLSQIVSARNKKSNKQFRNYRLKNQTSVNGQKRSSSLIYQPEIAQGVVKLKIRHQPQLRSRRVKTLV